MRTLGVITLIGVLALIVIAIHIAVGYGLYTLFIWLGAPKWIAGMVAISLVLIGSSSSKSSKD